jgi:hypothetical protein
MNDRDYLRSLGFTVGERGRFSKEMLTAIASRSDTKTDNPVSVMKMPAAPVRERTELYGFTRGGARLAFITCSSCGEHMIWCECEKIVAPDNVMVLHGAAKDLAVIHPRMLQLITAY